jgi:hypothetical protein
MLGSDKPSSQDENETIILFKKTFMSEINLSIDLFKSFSPIIYFQTSVNGFTCKKDTTTILIKTLLIKTILTKTLLITTLLVKTLLITNQFNITYVFI